MYEKAFCFLKVDVGKSPLAMLAKTCETIGLPDTPSRKSAKDDKLKDSTTAVNHSPSGSSLSSDSKKDDLSPLQKKKEGSRSPRTTTHSPLIGKKTPITSEPSTSTAPLPTNMLLNQRANFFPMPFPSLGSSFPLFPYPPIIPGFPAMPAFAPNAFPATAATAPSPTTYLRCVDPTCKGCPLMTRSCPTPGCVSCSMHSPVTTPTVAAAAAAADMITAFSSPFFTSYNPLMAPNAVSLPPTSSSSAQLAYQNLMAAAAGSQTSKHICNWPDTTGICGKTFNSADELTSHMKVRLTAHTSAVATAAVTSNNVVSNSCSNSNTANTGNSSATSSNANNCNSINAASNTSAAINGTELKSISPKISTTAVAPAPLPSRPSLRYHPYMKPGAMLPSLTPLSNPLAAAVPSPFALPTFPTTVALQAMYAQQQQQQRIITSMPHP
uniref:C2H2-type domain-containing protein n=1 Tax=Syphacia muris TaxID=451379 RepID=A0A0N5B0P4_9BILA